MEEDKRVPIDRGWAWVILVANFIVVFLVIGCTSSFGLFFAEFMSEYKASASSITVALSVQTVIFSFSSLFALNFGTGLASSRTYIILGGLFGCSAYVISAIIKDMSYLILSHGVIFGIAYGFSYGPALVVLSRYFNKKRGMAATLGNMGASFGSLIFPPVIRILLDNYGLKGALVIIGGLLLNLCVAGALMRPVAFYKERISGNKVNSKDILSNQKVWTTNNYGKHDRNHTPNFGNHTIKENCTHNKLTQENCNKGKMSILKIIVLDTKNKSKIKNICNIWINFEVLQNVLFRMWIPVCFLAIIGCVQIVVFIPPHAKDLQIADSKITLLVIMIGASNLLSKIFVAFLIHRNCMSKTHMMAVSLIITGASCMLISLYTNFLTMSFLSVTFGVFGSVYFGLFPAVIAEFVGLDNLSSAMAINMMMQGLGLSISNPILGYLRDTSGSFYASFYVMGSTLIISGVILFLEPLCRKLEKRRTDSKNIEQGVVITP
ncbi:monocarboxylate transporter 12-like isoform X1 [Saccostrea echinata]|uniref:monocarboxylate transporter 12-like isoform X1 n=1 Tax=Saccostrea echinata TaxID=191078 RepID=UPI002A8175F2|nr:monocarboxylate transporter 12-like isoform X1 [Saccostrea echinata]